MSITHSGLREKIQDYTENRETSFTDQLDNIIRDAELALSRRLDLTEFRQHKTSTFEAGSPFVVKPNDVVDFRSLFYQDADGELRGLDLVESSYVRTYWPDRAATGAPRYWAHWDDETLIVAATPAQAFVIEMEGRFYPTGLSSVQTTTWLSTHADDVLFQACMVQAYLFEKNAEDGDRWAAVLEQSLASLAEDESVRQYRDELRHGSYRG